MAQQIPVIDLFAGPGGLGEGFSAYQTNDDKPFRIGLSIEKDPHAHRTLLLRSFYRQFPPKSVPNKYYAHLRGEISQEQLLGFFPEEARSAAMEARCATLGTDDPETIDAWIDSALDKRSVWILIGGPPCQAYSLVGRSRMRGATDYRQAESFDDDRRHTLYREYLRILAKHSPPIFVMENVKGILSSTLKGEAIFPRILEDLRAPGEKIRHYPELAEYAGDESEYAVFSFVKDGASPRDLTPSDFLIRSEDYGIPQCRHRVILLGIRTDLLDHFEYKSLLQPQDSVHVRHVIEDLPRLRSGMSKGRDTYGEWKRVLRSVLSTRWFQSLPEKMRKQATQTFKAIGDGFLLRGSKYVTGYDRQPKRLSKWFLDDRLPGVCNHETRGHMNTDLKRYLYATLFAEVNGVSPSLHDFPHRLLPNHKNARPRQNDYVFADRFRVQVWDRPSTTVTSHISKDGHYFIHPAPSQCRSLTVREAARLQTFPDNYFFEGPRTAQYQQVGNAVPPLLAWQLAEVVYGILASSSSIPGDNVEL